MTPLHVLDEGEGRTVREIARGLTKAEVAALETLPVPHDADPVRWIKARPYASTWRKSSKHWDALRSLEYSKLVERTVSRGETLWRLTRPLGLAVREYLLANPEVQ